MMLNNLITPMLLTTTLLMQPAVLMTAESPGFFESPAMQLLLTGLATAGILFLTNWLTQHNLKGTLANLKLSAEITARELEGTKRAQEKIAEATAENTIAQAEIGAKVNGQMTELHRVIDSLRGDLAAAKLAVVTEKEKAVPLAIQAERDKAQAEAQLLAATKAPDPQGGGASVSGSVTIPETTVPVLDR